MSRFKDDISKHSLVDGSSENQEQQGFPIDVTPDDMNLYSEETCRLEGVSHELVIPQLLGMIGALAGSSVYIQGIGGSDLRLNTFTITSAKSGVGKSRVMKKLNRAIIDFEKEIQKEWAREILPRTKTKLKQIEEQYSEGDIMPEDLFDKKRSLLRQLHQPKFFVEDITSERLIERLYYNDETILLNSSDGRKPISNILGEYRKRGTDESIYLKGYSGDPHDTERKDKDANIRLESPCVSIVLMVQPDKVEDLFQSKELCDSGFLARCFYVNVDLEPKEIKLESLIPDEAKLGIAYDKLIAIGRAYYRQNKTHHIQFEDDAYSAFVKYHNKGVVDRRTGGKHADISEFASRWPEGHFKLIGQLHLWKYGEKAPAIKVNVDDVRNAEKILEWFIANQMTFLEEFKCNKRAQKRQVLMNFLQRQGGSADRSSVLKGTKLKSAELNSILKENPTIFQTEMQPIQQKNRVREIISVIKRR